MVAKYTETYKKGQLKNALKYQLGIIKDDRLIVLLYASLCFVLSDAF